MAGAVGRRAPAAGCQERVGQARGTGDRRALKKRAAARTDERTRRRMARLLQAEVDAGGGALVLDALRIELRRRRTRGSNRSSRRGIDARPARALLRAHAALSSAGAWSASAFFMSASGGVFCRPITLRGFLKSAALYARVRYLLYSAGSTFTDIGSMLSPCPTTSLSFCWRTSRSTYASPRLTCPSPDRRGRSGRGGSTASRSASSRRCRASSAARRRADTGWREFDVAEILAAAAERMREQRTAT